MSFQVLLIVLSLFSQNGETDTITIDSSFKYMVFTYRAPFTGQQTELYPDANMQWPTTYTIKGPKSEVIMLGNETEAVKEISLSMEGAGDNLYIINSQSPGSHAHCTQIAFAGGKSNEYYQGHAYQYVEPVWIPGPCDAKYNWFNNNSTIAPGVVQTLFGIH